MLLVADLVDSAGPITSTKLSPRLRKNLNVNLPPSMLPLRSFNYAESPDTKSFQVSPKAVNTSKAIDAMHDERRIQNGQFKLISFTNFVDKDRAVPSKFSASMGPSAMAAHVHYTASPNSQIKDKNGM